MQASTCHIFQYDRMIGAKKDMSKNPKNNFGSQHDTLLKSIDRMYYKKPTVWTSGNGYCQ